MGDRRVAGLLLADSVFPSVKGTWAKWLFGTLAKWLQMSKAEKVREEKKIYYLWMICC